MVLLFLCFFLKGKIIGSLYNSEYEYNLLYKNHCVITEILSTYPVDGAISHNLIVCPMLPETNTYMFINQVILLSLHGYVYLADSLNLQ